MLGRECGAVGFDLLTAHAFEVINLHKKTIRTTIRVFQVTLPYLGYDRDPTFLGL